MARRFHEVKVWDLTVRLFHWINFASLLGLIGVGLVILTAGDLGVPTEGKIALKQVHVLIGYVFAINLLIRIVWGFIGSGHARWSTLLSFGSAYRQRLRDYIAARKAGGMPQFEGHDPLGQVAVAVLYLLLLTQAATGLFLAGSDLYWPPFGSMIAEWVAATGVDPGSLRPYGAKELLDSAAFDEMRALRKPIIEIHEYGFYALIAMGILHVAAVAIAEVRGGNGLVSAMITGRKHLAAPVEEGKGEGRAD
ncbi:MAG: cytochrome b/b6 domain-containing protein [Rhodothalassiaceae bacterium]